MQLCKVFGVLLAAVQNLNTTVKHSHTTQYFILLGGVNPGNFAEICDIRDECRRNLRTCRNPVYITLFGTIYLNNENWCRRNLRSYRTEKLKNDENIAVHVKIKCKTLKKEEERKRREGWMGLLPPVFQLCNLLTASVAHILYMSENFILTLGLIVLFGMLIAHFECNKLSVAKSRSALREFRCFRTISTFHPDRWWFNTLHFANRRILKGGSGRLSVSAR